MLTAIRVLIVEDSEDDTQLVLRQLRNGGYDPQWKRVETAEGMTRALEEPWDAIICDYALPHFDALAALEIVQSRGTDIPFVIVSGKIGEDVAVAAMKAGAHDYVMKDRLVRLPAAVEREMGALEARRQRAQADERIRVSFEQGAVAQALTSLDGRFLRVNQALASLLGYARGDLAGKSFHDVTHPDDRTVGLDPMRALLAGSPPVRFEKRYVTRGGQLLWVDVNMALARDPAGQPQYFLGTFVDVTAQKRSHEAMRESEAKFRMLFQSNQAILGLSTLKDGRYIDVNDAFLRLVGYTREEVIGQTALDLGIWGSAEQRNTLLGHLGRRDGVQNLEVEARTRSGSSRILLCNVERLDYRGEPCLLVSAIDDTDRQRTRKELERYRIQLEAMVEQRTKEISLLSQLTFVSLESASVGAWWIDFAEDDTYHALDTTAKLLGVPVSCAPDKAYRISEWMDLLATTKTRAPELAERVDEAIEQFAGTISGRYEKYRVVYPVVLADGTLKWIDARADVSSRDGSGRAEKMTGTLIDVTKLVEVETNLTAHKVELEGLVTQRTEELAQRNWELQERLVLETLVADLAARFVNVDVRNLDAEIEEALKRICDCLDMDFGAVWQSPDDNPETLVMTHLYRRDQRPAPSVVMDAKEYFPWVHEQLSKNRSTFLLSHLDELPPEAARDRETYEQEGIANALNVPFLDTDGRLGGVISFNNTSSRPFAKLLMGRLEMIAHLLLGLLVRARADRAMALGNERMRFLTEMLDEAPAGVMVSDGGGSLFYANRYAAEMHGYTPDELGSCCLTDFVAPEAQAQMNQHMGEVMQRGESSFDIWHMRKDRSSVHVHVRARKTQWMDRPAVLSVQADLTERERSARALRESEERYRFLAERVADVVWVLDPTTGKCLYVSPSVESLRGYTVEEVMAQPLEASLAPESREVMKRLAYEALERIAKGSQVGILGVHLVHQMRKDGTTVPTEVKMECLRDQATGKPLILGVSRDITERMQAERSRQELQAQLSQAQKMEAIGRLAGGVAHDFNNLLSVILGCTGFVMDSVAVGDPRREDLEEVKKAADRAVMLTHQLLAFSRKQVFQAARLDLNQIARGVEKMLRRILGEDIEFVQELAPDLGQTFADPGQVEQVLMNLVVNARDAMRNGGKLTIRTANVEIDEQLAASLTGVTPGPFIEMTVTDTGCGMDAQTKARLFEPFFTTKEKGKGTGLGLSTVFGIVKQSGGDVRVLSEPGQGSTFKVYLPREPASPVDLAVTPATFSPPSTGLETILVVEDEEALRNVARRVLVAAGYSVLTVAGGMEALRVCAQHDGRIHLVLTDVIMPGMSGKQLADRMAEAYPAAKILFMSGYTDDAIAHHGVLNEGTHFLHKPFTPAELAGKVREVLDSGPPSSGSCARADG